jgi:hypothetical protein
MLVKTKPHLLLSLLFVGSTAFCQDVTKNLVLNPDMETVTGCPDNDGEIDKVVHWTGTRTTDYFSTCATNSMVQAPNRRPGYAEPNSGNAFAGIILVQKDYRHHDYLIGSLRDTLVKDSVYCFSMYVRLAENSPYSVDWLSVYFSDTNGLLPPNERYQYTRFPFYSSEYNRLTKLGEPIRTTQSWTLVKTSYKAKGGEKYFWIGGGGPWSENPPRMIRTFIKENPKIEFIDPDHSVYYFIDDVYLYHQASVEKGAIKVLHYPDCSDHTVKLGLPEGASNIRWSTGSQNTSLSSVV